MKFTRGKTISPLKKFGGKSGLAKRIIEKMEYRRIFVEGFCATSIVSLSLMEKFDLHFCFDIDPFIINFWQVLQNEPGRLQQFLKHTEYSEENFERAKEHLRLHEEESGDPFFDSAMYFICNRMSRSADMKTFGWSDRLRRGMPEYISAYRSAVDNLLYISSLVEHINFFCGDYQTLMIDLGLNENPDVVQYLDPPYQHESRISKKSYGKYELPTFCSHSDDGCLSHECLISFIKTGCAGVTYLSGYNSPEYEKWLKDYTFYEWSVANSASQAKKKPKKQERLYVINNTR